MLWRGIHYGSLECVYVAQHDGFLAFWPHSPACAFRASRDVIRVVASNRAVTSGSWRHSLKICGRSDAVAGVPERDSVRKEAFPRTSCSSFKANGEQTEVDWAEGRGRKRGAKWVFDLSIRKGRSPKGSARYFFLESRRLRCGSTVSPPIKHGLRPGNIHRTRGNSKGLGFGRKVLQGVPQTVSISSPTLTWLNRSPW